jgi:hypothetical protein
MNQYIDFGTIFDYIFQYLWLVYKVYVFGNEN